MNNVSKIFGIRAVIEAIKSEKTLDKVFVQKGLRGELFQQLDQLLRQNSVNVSYVPIEKLNRLTKKNHQGVVAHISPIEYHELDNLIMNVFESGETPLFLLLDQLSDVRNFGAIIRTAECTGVHGIIIQKKGGAPVNGDTVKTSAGAIFKIPICKVDHIKDAMFHLQASGIKVIAATEKTTCLMYDTSFKEPCAIIMGSEGKGISPSILKLADASAKLPLLGEIASLNVSVACGVLLYEVVRQRR
ncbi:23S rRNA (guanosine(2251)-2'-O)-methyltransferase RlmB [Flavobacteriaceae bacterium]|mgnify:FL=1|jgi:23S rRNA (guanosine2251-2'-O)-methyltransferase|nr:23S rRNA (guanosine(2251)-2'-O)-methyltransferase RlmB [Bacteroidota bacterium]MDA7567754.1 23S rRNA (guanosine(2251)-2'-O)-methyltransferase RlmB [Flavobacteriaceae bacterium]MDA9552605.1 23S rRNA (guanosine(2251)-2'-O)-methyltransferase RlmB [Flavobacteriaceae bacterium]MDB2612144.1 23S rRNA (guanosine(2251)-2'-O)-methyltransferase RlmB [Flavobacteriaceae bacterium]MDC0956822.1 23S rRNA (guanosine(2251)-2'-O)-methyltransferase RlmB [Flavobacteriaceae bacterium]|tara:strand:+ start:248 stop:982 length:735 start_codon:yes stop_codon:yes gene_type:complete